jgi:hypothetical protein
MKKVSFLTVNEIEHALIDYGNGEFTSMTKAHYDELQVANEAAPE